MYFMLSCIILYCYIDIYIYFSLSFLFECVYIFICNLSFFLAKAASGPTKLNQSIYPINREKLLKNNNSQNGC